MRVLLVTALVAGGVGRHAQMLALGLAAHGHRVVVACPEAVSRSFDLGDATVALPVSNLPHPVRDAAAVRTLRAHLRGTDVVHAHGLRAGALAVLARASLPAGRGAGGRREPARPRLVVTHHNGPPRAGAARLPYLVLERLVARNADLILGVSPDLVERARRAGARRTAPALVPAAPVARVDRGAARAALEAELRLPRGAPLVVGVGRLAAQKRMDVLVEAMQRLADDRRGAGDRPPVLLLAGEGPERPALRERLTRPGTGPVLDARLLGRRDDVPSLLAAADVVVSTAEWEGQPVWLQEALAQGAAVVATDVGGTAGVLGGAGLLVPSATGRAGHARLVDAVARAVAAVLDDPELQQELRARALTRAAALPTERDALEAALAAYASVP